MTKKNVFISYSTSANLSSYRSFVSHPTTLGKGLERDSGTSTSLPGISSYRTSYVSFVGKDTLRKRLLSLDTDKE